MTSCKLILITPLTECSLGQYSIMLCTRQHPFQYCDVHVSVSANDTWIWP